MSASERQPSAAAANLAIPVADTHAYVVAIIESSLDPVIGCDLAGTVTCWNPSAESTFGYTASEIMGRPIRQLLPADRADEQAEVLQRLQRGERVIRQAETQRLTKDGRLVDVSIAFSPIRSTDGRLIGVSETLRDITAALHDQRELHRIARLYEALRQINQVIVATTDRDGLLHEVCRILVEQGGFQIAWVGWADSATHRLMPVAQFGDDNDDLGKVSVYTDERPEGLGPCGIAFRSGQPCISNDVLDDPASSPWRTELRRRGVAASAALPIRRGGAVCAVLCVYADRRNFFRDEEMALLSEAVEDISMALESQDREQARQRAERVMRDETEFSNTMLDSMPGVVYFYDSTGRFLRWNRNFEVVTGYSSAEIAGMHPLDFFSADDHEWVTKRIAEVFANGESTVEAMFRSKAGTLTPYFFTGRRVLFKDRPCLVGVGIDITERKRAEAALVESRAHLLEAQRIASIGSWSLDLPSHRLSWSDQTCAIFGVDQATTPSSYEAMMAFVHPDDRQSLDAAHRSTLAGQAPLDIVHRIVLHDGSERVVHSLAAVHRDAAGQVVGLAGTAHDITARVRLQDERERREHAEAADRIKSAFLATMSHELRTPLNSIIGFTGILLQGLAGPLNAEQNTQLGMVRTSARHLLALVNDVLDISKIEAGQLEIAAAPFDLRRAIDKVAALIAPQAKDKQLALKLALAPDLGAAVGDERRLQQIVLNLLSNAVKFTERGEIVLRAERLAAPAALRLQVCDTGIGIRPADMAMLFQPFRQIDDRLSRQHEGTGLGLAICQRLAGLMGGTINVESVWGVGSTFTLQLPLEKPPSP